MILDWEGYVIHNKNKYFVHAELVWDKSTMTTKVVDFVAYDAHENEVKLDDTIKDTIEEMLEARRY